MFSEGHLIWIGLSLALIAAGLIYCLRRRPPLKRLLTFCLAAGAVSEIIKYFSAVQIVPMVDPVVATEGGETVLQWISTGSYTPYLAKEHLPLELCSLYLFFMLLALVLKDGPWKKGLYAVMFASGSLGGMLGIVAASIAGDFETTAAFFSSPRAWQFFLFHSMIVVISIYLAVSEEAGLSEPDWKKSAFGLLLLDLPTFYLNSVLSTEVYVHDQVVGVTHRINFFSSYVNPFGIVLTETWQWALYLVLRAGLFLGVVRLLFLLLRRKTKGKGTDGTEPD